jgi:hypothetical protein
MRIVLATLFIIIAANLGQLVSLSSNGKLFDNNAAAPIITLSQGDLKFNGLAGGSAPADRAFRIINSGPVGSTLNYTISATQPWLSPSPASGSLAAGESVTVTVTAITAGMTGGTYGGTLNVINNSAINSTPINALLVLNNYASVETAGITSKRPDANGYDLVHVQASGHAFGSAAAVPNVSGGSFLWVMMMDRSALFTGETFNLTTSDWTAVHALYDRIDLFPDHFSGASRDEGQPSIISWSASGDFRVLPGQGLDMRARLSNPDGSGDDSQYGFGLLNSPITASIGASTNQASVNPYANALLTIQLSQRTTNPITVKYVVSGTAHSGIDFLSLPGAVTILPGADTAVIPLIPIATANSTGGIVNVTLIEGDGYVFGTNRTATVKVVQSPRPVEVTGLTDFTIPPSTSKSSSTRAYQFSVVDSVTRAPVPNASVNFKYTPQPMGGGHDHDDSSRPAYSPDTTLSAVSATGNFNATYVAPLVSGRVDFEIECSVPDGRPCKTGIVSVDVKVSNLEQLGPNVNYVLTGATNTHLSNHYGLPNLNAKLVGLANDYAAKFNGDKLSYNDMSLVWGGLFDCNSDCRGTFWNQPHVGHNLGSNADVGLVPPARRGQFIQLAWNNNLGVLKEPTHWHLTYGRGDCKILHGKDCSPTQPPLNSVSPAEVAAASGLTIQVTPNVTFNSQTGIYTYQYSVHNDSSSLLDLSGFQILLSNAVVSNLQSPQGWTASLWKDTSAVAFAATEIGPLPADYVDDGNLVPSPFQIKPGQTLAGFSFESPDAPGTVDLLAQGFKKIPDLVSEDDTQQPELFDGAFTGTTIAPAPIQLVLHEVAGGAAALDSLLFSRDPFPVVNLANLLNKGPDHNTRVIVFVMNLQLAQGEPSSSVVVNLVDSNNQSYDVIAEDVRPLAIFNFTQVTFRLPDNLPAGTCTIKVKAHDQVSNAGTIRIS